MLDARIRPFIDPPLNRAGHILARAGVSADAVTLAGLVIGLTAAWCIMGGAVMAALALIVVSRLADGLDGAIARAAGPSDFGGFLDIVCDFLFYGAVPLAFVAMDPATNGLAGAFLLMTFYFNGTTFLGFAVLAEKKQMRTDRQGVKSLYFAGGLLGGTETIAFFVLICLFPAHFAAMAWVFGTLCLFTGASRILLAHRVFGQ